MNIYLAAAFFAYFAILLSIGLVFHKKQTSSSDFIMGNRSLNFWLVALSAHASDMSAWLFMAFPMTIFVLGLSHLWTAFGLLAGMFLNWHFVAPKLRSMTESYGCCTLSSFFEKRFADTSGLLRLISALVMTIFLTHYLSAGLIAMGDLFESLFGLNYTFGLSVALCVVVIYTFFGGFTTVAWTDLFQALFLILMILLVPYVAFGKIGGWGAVVLAAERQNISLSLFSDSWISFASVFCVGLSWGLGYFGMPHIITKFMGIRDVSEMYKSKWVGMSWQLIALTASALVGLIAIAYFPDGLEKPSMVFVEMVKDLFPTFFSGFILCGVIAANMSTMDSQILVCSSILSEDLYKHFYKILPTDRQVLWVSKLSVLLISIVAMLFAMDRNATVLDTVFYSWSGLGSAFGPLVLMSLYVPCINRYGALAGIIVGTSVVMLWPSLNPMLMSFEIPPMIPGFALSGLSIYFLSVFTQKNSMLSKV